MKFKFTIIIDVPENDAEIANEKSRDLSSRIVGLIKSLGYSWDVSEEEAE